MKYGIKILLELVDKKKNIFFVRTKRFVRWRRGSCIPVTPIKQADGEPFVYSFYTDIGRLPRILSILLQIQENLQTILRNLWQYLKK